MCGSYGLAGGGRVAEWPLGSALSDAILSGGGRIQFYAVTGSVVVMDPLPPFPANIDLVGPGANAVILAVNLTIPSGARCLLAGMTVGRIQNAGSLVLSNI